MAWLVWSYLRPMKTFADISSYETTVETISISIYIYISPQRPVDDDRRPARSQKSQPLSITSRQDVYGVSSP